MKMRAMLLAAAMTLATAAALADEKVLFENNHIRLVDVLLAPGQHQLPAVPYPSIWMVDAAWPTVSGTEGYARTLARDNGAYPWCRTQAAQPARTVTVSGNFPQHYYRIEYKRVDGKDYATKWQSWYSKEFAPSRSTAKDLGTSLRNSPPASKEFPFDQRYNATDAAPANHSVLYDDAHMQLLEVVIRPGETENMHGHPLRSIYADDGGFSAAGANFVNVTLLPNEPPPWGKMSAPPPGAEYPICFTGVPESPHQVTVKSGPPQHFYRLQYKRVDGEDFRTRWREWYAGR